MSSSRQNGQLYLLPRTPIAVLIGMIFSVPALVLTSAVLSPAYAAEMAAEKHVYSIPAAPLAAQLNQFAAQSGIYLASDAQFTAGKSGSALNESYTVTWGIFSPFKGSGFTG